MPKSLAKSDSYALVKGETQHRKSRRPVFRLFVPAALLLLFARHSATAQEANSVPESLNLFAAYHPELNSFPFAQPDNASAQQPEPNPPAAQHPDLPGAPSANTAQTDAGDCAKPPCKAKPPIVDWYMRFVTGPTPKILTPKDKAFIAARSIIDPFNMITILGEGAISVAADSHSAYGPGFPGFGRYVGVSFTEDITGEFFNTFLIPSLTHQDPRYHRMPKATIPHRILHAIYQVAWTQSDYGKGMLNYGNLAGFAIDDEIGNLYVPGRETRASATAQRYAIGLATAPIDNFISEFLPDVARHVHIQVVVVQRIINHIASTDNNAF